MAEKTQKQIITERLDQMGIFLSKFESVYKNSTVFNYKQERIANEAISHLKSCLSRATTNQFIDSAFE